MGRNTLRSAITRGFSLRISSDGTERGRRAAKKDTDFSGSSCPFFAEHNRLYLLTGIGKGQSRFGSVIGVVFSLIGEIILFD